MILRTMSRIPHVVLAGFLGAVLAAPAAAQGIAWTTTTVLYGDNTEFFTPYRTGETILGAQFFSSLRLHTGERTSIHPESAA